MITPNQHLVQLRSALKAEGHDLWFVGGCVRDTLRGEDPKDVDLCTSATPDEAMAIYRQNNLRYFKTGIEHGTLSVRINKEIYEITTLRTESEHDGRRAVVAYTRDLNDDLSRRDLTINAIAQDFDGNIIDPFGGVSDLENERVRMVGDAVERFEEDYLRILRYFRFHARFAGEGQLDKEAFDAVLATAKNLKDISGERIWQEMRKILVGPSAATTMNRMHNCGVLRAIQVNNFNTESLRYCVAINVDRAPMRLGFSMVNSNLEETMTRFRMSNAEKSEARFANRNKTKHSDVNRLKEMLVDGIDPLWVDQMCLYNSIGSLSDWKVPVFPVDGVDLMKRGLEGPNVGNGLRTLKDRWKKSGYEMKKSELLETL